MAKKILILLPIISSILIGCRRSEVYFESYSFPSKVWEADSVLSFDVVISDTASDYSMEMVLWHDKSYPYQNMWLFVDQYMEDSILLHDTIECMVADERGRWLGSGYTSYQLSLLYMSHVHYPQEGCYRYCVRQGMREEALAGVKAFGLSVHKQENDGQK